MSELHEVYSTVDLKQVLGNIERWIDELKPQLRSHEDYDEEALDYYIDLCKELARIAPSFDFQNIPCNGWRSLLRFNQHFIFKSLGSLKRIEIADFLLFIKLFSFYITNLIEAHRLNIQGRHDEEVAVHRKNYAEIDATISDLMNVLCNSRYFALNYPQYKFHFNLIMRLFAQRYKSSNLIVGSIFWYLPFSSVKSSFVKMLGKLDSEKVSRAINSVDELAMRLTAKTVYTARTLFESNNLAVRKHKVTVESRYRFKIDQQQNATVLERVSDPVSETIKFRVMRNRNEAGEFNNKIFLYIHGGGFVGPRASSLQDLYVKWWCNQLDGCTLINIDYPLAPQHKFPSQIQTIVDFYLWLTSGDEQVIKIFNFKPTEIIVGGDSAGANLSVALVIALNDINRMKDNVMIQMPKSVVPMFGVFEWPRRLLPSSLSSASDIAVSYPAIKVMAKMATFRVYPLSGDANNNVIKSQWKLQYLDDDSPSSFLTDATIEPEPSPYIQCSLYDRFDDEAIKSVDLFILGIDFCPFLDQSITLAKQWKGKVTFRHVDITPHGAFFFHLLSPQLPKNLMDTCVDLIRGALRA